MGSNYLIHADDLMFEITRRCNMKCEHCLRGKAENVDIDTKIIDTVLEQLESVGAMCFTGGEPSLNVQAIRHTLEQVKALDLMVMYFWLATNAKEFSSDFVMTLMDWYAYCKSIDNDAYGCGLAISLDQFHEEVPIENIRRYQALTFYSDEKADIIEEDRIIDDGYATANQLGRRNLKDEPKQNLAMEVEDGRIRLEETLYINAKGDVITTCDLSYESQKRHTWGNVLEEPLETILLRAGGYTEVEEVA